MVGCSGLLSGSCTWFGWKFSSGLACFVLYLFCVGCGAEPVGQTAESGVSVSPSVLSTPVADQELVPTSVESIVGDSVRLASVANSLASLDSYRLSWDLSFDGVDSESSPVSWRLSNQVISMSDPPAEEMEISAVGFEPSAELSELKIVQIVGQKFLEIEGVGCLSGIGQAPGVVANDLTDPDSFLAGLSTAQQISIGEMKDGMRVNQYSLDEKSLPTLDGLPVTAEGTIYFSQESGIPIQVMLSVTGPGDYLSSGEDQDGSLTMVLQVHDINQPLVVEIPDACRGTSIYPVVQDAYKFTVLGDLISYQTSLPVLDVALFYQREMPLAGWTEAEEALVIEEMALMSYERDGVVVVIAVDSEPGQGETSVLITP